MRTRKGNVVAFTVDLKRFNDRECRAAMRVLDDINMGEVDGDSLLFQGSPADRDRFVGALHLAGLAVA